jgi:hypothetical protein
MKMSMLKKLETKLPVGPTIDNPDSLNNTGTTKLSSAPPKFQLKFYVLFTVCPGEQSSEELTIFGGK